METYEEILRRMEEAYKKESGHPAADVSDTGLRLKVLAGELYRLQAEIQWIARQAFPQTATGEWLERHGAQRGVFRREALPAKGQITLSRYLPLPFDMVIPKGTVCAIPGEVPIEYETLEDVVLQSGQLSVSVPAQAVIKGAAGNAAAGRINTLTTPQSGVNYVTNKAAFTGGKDRESEEAYRLRVLNAYGDLPNGTNAAFYRDVALSFDGVSAAGVKPRVNGANTVGVYLWGNGEAPSAETIAAVRAELERRREIGVTVMVQAASEKPVNVGVRFSLRPGADFTKAKEDVIGALNLYLGSLPMGSPVYKTELERVVLEAAPVAELEFAASVKDIAGDVGKVPVPGTITVEEIV